MNTEPAETPGVFTGHSLFDGAQGWFAIDAHPELLLIDYRVGPKDALRRRISARIVPGAVLGLAENHCLVTLLAWRTSDMGDERWQRLCATHEAEIWLIKAQIERKHENNRSSVAAPAPEQN
jgi:hypothetical protein